MNARVVTVQLKQDKSQEASSFFETSVAEALKSQPGFHSTRMLIDELSNKCLMVTLWQTLEDLKASEANGFLKEQLAQLSQFFATSPIIDRYELTVQVMA